jgi:hypothetical protein
MSLVLNPENSTHHQHCLHCDHNWESYIHRPIMCPSCGRRRWWLEKRVHTKRDEKYWLNRRRNNILRTLLRTCTSLYDRLYATELARSQLRLPDDNTVDHKELGITDHLWMLQDLVKAELPELGEQCRVARARLSK